MGTLFSAFDIGRAALQVNQVQLDVTAHNISNVSKEGYSRQRVNVVSREPIYRSYGAIGRGPAIAGVERLRESFLDNVYRQQVPGLGSAETQAALFQRLEDIFQEPSDIGFSERFNNFFDSLQDLANNVEDLPVRVSVLSEAQALADAFNQIDSRLNILRDNANEEIRGLIPEVNGLSEQISRLNETIRNAELNDRTANDLRDDRDVLVDQLARLVDITYRERESGEIDILLGGEQLVNGTDFRALEAVPTSAIDPERDDLLQVQFVDNGQPVLIRSGELFGALRMRDTIITDVADQIDTLASTMIQEINRVHASGNGISDYSTITSTTLLSPVGPLNSVGVPFPVQDGSFAIRVYDAAGNLAETLTVPVQTTGPVVNQTTLSDIEAAINTSANLTASISADGAITIDAAAGFTFGFANDTSDVLPALGLNVLFTGTNAGNIGVNQVIAEDPALLSTAFSADPTETGDNTAALALAAVRDQEFLNGGTQTLNEYYQATVVQVGIDANANLEQFDVEEAFVADFERRRQEVSGVDLNEEVTFLLQFQRAFEAAARIITTTDRMLETLINVAR
ncbi:MAG: flagellar hook-associated protein FlgK [Candidatus Hydrogenedentes bacterium]|nr:flagellar hook-associated protein FlgK [Candidatus Hydrogenedentota bacterium]